MKNDKHKSIRRDVIYNDPTELDQEGLDLDDEKTLAELGENPEWDEAREHATDEMFGVTQNLL